MSACGLLKSHVQKGGLDLMSTKQHTERHDLAAAELLEYCPELDTPQQIVDSLAVGLTHLRNMLLARTRDDVKCRYGTDSMLGVSLSEIERQDRLAKVEIESYASIVITDEVIRNGYVGDRAEWFLDWMFHLRLGDGYKSVMDKRVAYYKSLTVEERRLKFVSVLQRVLPESARTPLVLFRLFPRSIRILTAVAFGDRLRANEMRAEQIGFLPGIADCHECHGRVLDNEDSCRCCGNPVWNFTFLLSD